MKILLKNLILENKIVDGIKNLLSAHKKNKDYLGKIKSEQLPLSKKIAAIKYLKGETGKEMAALKFNISNVSKLLKQKK